MRVNLSAKLRFFSYFTKFRLKIMDFTLDFEPILSRKGVISR